MKINDYKCEVCKYGFEEVSVPGVTVECPQCGSTSVVKQFPVCATPNTITGKITK